MGHCHGDETGVTPIILAAGASSRMGRSKALLDFGGTTAVERILETCHRAGASKAIVVVGFDPEPIRKKLSGVHHAAVVENPDWERGQTSSIQRGVRSVPASSEAFMLWPVDLPLVAESTVGALLGVWKKGSALRRIFLPVFEGRRGHPVLFDMQVAGELLSLMGSEPAHAVVRKDPSRIREIPVSDPFVAAPLDTPEDYARLLAELRAREERT